jgi:hypothetical protein
LRGAIVGGAAGWCFHNGAQNGASASQPRRSFDLRDKRLFDQLDSEEMTVIAEVNKAVGEWSKAPNHNANDARQLWR